MIIDSAEKNYTVIEKEALAIIFAIWSSFQVVDRPPTLAVAVWCKERDTSHRSITLTKMGHPTLSLPIRYQVPVFQTKCRCILQAAVWDHTDDSPSEEEAKK